MTPRCHAHAPKSRDLSLSVGFRNIFWTVRPQFVYSLQLL